MTASRTRRSLKEAAAANAESLREVLRRRYFGWVAGILLFFTVWGFSDNLVWRIDQPSNRDPKFIAHGLFCLGWMVLLFAQAWLIRVRNVRLHRRLGVAGFFVAVGVVLSTGFVFYDVRRPWHEMSALVQGNRLLLAGFALLVLMAYLRRRRPEDHRRYVLLASIFMLEPVLSRAFDPIEPLLLGVLGDGIEAAWWVFFIVVWNGLLLSLVGYDLVTHRRVHRVTGQGIGLFYGIWLVVLLA